MNTEGKTKGELLAMAEALEEARGRAYVSPVMRARLTRQIKELRAAAEAMPAQEPEPVAWMIWAPFTGPAQFTTDRSAPLKCAQRADYECTPLYKHPARPDPRMARAVELLLEARQYVAFSKDMGDPHDLLSRLDAFLKEQDK